MFGLVGNEANSIAPQKKDAEFHDTYIVEKNGKLYDRWLAWWFDDYHFSSCKRY
jgi:hypothetical protein